MVPAVYCALLKTEASINPKELIQPLSCSLGNPNSGFSFNPVSITWGGEEEGEGSGGEGEEGSGGGGEGEGEGRERGGGGERRGEGRGRRGEKQEGKAGGEEKVEGER